MSELSQEPDSGWPPPPFVPPPSPRRAADGVLTYEAVTYARTFGYRPRLLDVHVPPAGAPVPAVVWIHGGGWMDGDRRFPPPTVPVDLLFGSILGAGLAVVTIDYRHSLEAPFPAQLHDVKAAIRYVRRFADRLGIDAARIGVFGESAGGHLAAMAALTGTGADPSSDPGSGSTGTDGQLEGDEGVGRGDTTVRCAVDWYGVSDIVAAASAVPALALAGGAGGAGPELPGVGDPYTALLGASPADRPDLAAAASPVGRVPSAVPPFLLVHGTADRLVPYSQSERLAEHLTGHGGAVELVPVHGADHIFLGSEEIPSIVARSVDFLARHLTAAG
ncbi:alpha/beta hydrolase [Kitasatospora sp. NPDC048540]|uniref:alpha/beta hydrolase n=1 Tax=unclassified Kitasatospora TaxID=2633591 RepID=UPI0005397595|nr:alpha/beta hydrolase [Kitasatospora sp. MBT63]